MVEIGKRSDLYLVVSVFLCGEFSHFIFRASDLSNPFILLGMVHINCVVFMVKPTQTHGMGRWLHALHRGPRMPSHQ